MPSLRSRTHRRYHLFIHKTIIVIENISFDLFVLLLTFKRGRTGDYVADKVIHSGISPQLFYVWPRTQQRRAVFQQPPLASLSLSWLSICPICFLSSCERSKMKLPGPGQGRGGDAACISASGPNGIWKSSSANRKRTLGATGARDARAAAVRMSGQP